MRLKVFLLGAALFLASCSKQKPVEPVIQVVRAGLVEEIQPTTEERYSVSIEPVEKVDLAFKSGGIVEQILHVRGADGRMRNVQAGDKVARNAELAQVRSLDYQHSLEQADAQHAQAQAQRAQAQAQRAQAQAELARARANLNTAHVDYVRTTNLFQSASLVKQQYDEAKGRYEANSAAVTAAEEGVRAAEDAIKAAENGVANAAAAVKEARLSLRDTTLNDSVRRLGLGSKRRSRKPGGRQDRGLHRRGYASGQSGLCGTRF